MPIVLSFSLRPIENDYGFVHWGAIKIQVKVSRRVKNIYGYVSKTNVLLLLSLSGKHLFETGITFGSPGTTTGFSKNAAKKKYF